MIRATGIPVLAAVLIMTAALNAGSEPAPYRDRNWSGRARAFARAVNVRASDIAGATARPRPGEVANFAPAPLTCSRSNAAEAGGVSLVPTPHGFVASAVSVRRGTRVAVQQMGDLLSSFGQFCLGRSLGEAGDLLQLGLMSFEVTGRRLELPSALGTESVGKTVLAEMTTSHDLAHDDLEAHRLGHPTPGAKVINVSGSVFRVGPAQILLMVVNERGEFAHFEFDRLLLALHHRAVSVTP
jgi:hypothetical protein